MADHRPRDTPNPEEAPTEHAEEATGSPGDPVTHDAETEEGTDAEVTEVPEDTGEPAHREPGDLGDLYLPDMKNTLMKEACKKGIALGAEFFIISCEGLKEFYEHTTLAVNTTNGKIHMYDNGEFDSFPLKASESPFPEDILREILKSEAEKKRESGIPGRNL